MSEKEFRGFRPFVAKNTQTDTFCVPSQSSNYLAITLQEGGSREKHRHPPATLLKMYNYEQEI